MATAAEIANDLIAQAKLRERTGQDTLVASLKRGARLIQTLGLKVVELERQAERAELERYRNGDDHGRN